MIDHITEESEMKNAMINTYNLIRRMISLCSLAGVGWIAYKIYVPVYALFMVSGDTSGKGVLLHAMASGIVLSGLVGATCLLIIAKLAWVDLDKDVE